MSGQQTHAVFALPPGCRRILVTGASGFVGGHLLALLATLAGPETVILRGGRDPVSDLVFDLKDAASVRRAVTNARPDVVFHLAGEASVASSGTAAARTWQLNLVGTLVLAQALSEVNPAATVLFTSSAEVYGRAFLGGPADETTRPVPTSVYAQTKLAAEQMLAAVLPRSATLIIVRPANHIGPGQDTRFVLPSFAAQLGVAERTGERAIIHVGNLDTERDFSDVRDMVRAYVALLAKLHGTCARETVNVASGRVRSIRSLLDMMREASLVDSEVVVDPRRARASEVPRAELVTDRLRSLIDWKPQVDMKQSIIDIVRRT